MDNVYAVVEDNIVTNIVMWDGAEEWEPEKGEAFPAPSNVGIGWSYVDGEYIAPPPLFDSQDGGENKHDV
ncbi:hypothetical protein QWU01_20355 [Kluyvera cryocrescens]|uniref:Uncharacterized protein n=1 Tax=Kluyvera cryocrescens TaxID=580 RepID=A0AAW9CBG2_KLUCR|nr:hypothetical protein [Kluyvera cryocrescens]MDW3779162.1 hypothetical protein [Kluyvera cryocrescens]